VNGIGETVGGRGSVCGSEEVSAGSVSGSLGRGTYELEEYQAPARRVLPAQRLRRHHDEGRHFDDLLTQPRREAAGNEGQPTSYSFTIVDGTGRYEGATGSGTIIVTDDDVNSDEQFDLSGRISIPHGGAR
jgi:hypothetical protein